MTPSDHDHRRSASHAAGAAARHPHHHRQHAAHHARPRFPRRQWAALRRGMAKTLRRPWVRRVLWGAAITVGVVALAVGGLWWRLSSGPIELDVATPWLKAAIEKNFGGKQTVSVGGTQIERDENGRTSLRLRDIVVRDADGIDGGERAEGRSRHFRHKPAGRQCACGKPQSRRRRNVGADRNRRPSDRLRRRQQAADRHRLGEIARAAARAAGRCAAARAGARRLAGYRRGS